MDKRYYSHFSLWCMRRMSGGSLTLTRFALPFWAAYSSAVHPFLLIAWMHSGYLLTYKKKIYSCGEKLVVCMSELKIYFFVVKHGSNHKHSNAFVILDSYVMSYLCHHWIIHYLQLISPPLHGPTPTTIQQGQRGQIVLHTWALYYWNLHVSLHSQPLVQYITLPSCFWIRVLYVWHFS